MTRKVFYGWVADKDKVVNGVLSVKKDDIIKSEYIAENLSTGGICLFRDNYIYFDDEIDKVEFLFNDGELPDWVKPLILDESDTQRLPIGLDLYTIECVRDLIYWWFEEYCHKKLSKERKDRIAKIVGLNYHHDKYCKFIDYGFNHPEHIKWSEKDYKKRHKLSNLDKTEIVMKGD